MCTTTHRNRRPFIIGLVRALAITLSIGALEAGLARTASAQPLVNPRIVEFSPSADHNVTLPDNSAAVTRYDFELYLAGASAPFHTVNLGKPGPEQDGKVRVNFSAMIASWPLPGGTYESRVAAVGPGGTGRSTASNTFQFVTCSYVPSTTALSLGASAGTRTVGIVAPAGCDWTSSSNASWVTVTSGTGTANATVTYEANPTANSRTATLTIGGQAVQLTQAGVACSYEWSPTSMSLPAAAATGKTAAVVSPVGCAWTAQSSASWLTLTAASGDGNGQVTFSLTANTGTADRQATLTVNGKALTVTQAGTPLPAPAAPQSLRVITAQ